MGDALITTCESKPSDSTSDSEISFQYYFYNTGFNLSRALYSSTYALYLTQTLLLPLRAIPILLALHLASITLLELPTGAFADTKGRKRSFILGLALSATGYMSYVIAAFPMGVAHRFSMACVAEIILAGGYTFYSGSLDAWFVDLSRFSSRDQLKRSLVWAHFLKNCLFTIGGIAGAIAFFCALRIWTSPFFLSAIVCLILLPIAILKMCPDQPTSETTEPRPKRFRLARHMAAALSHVLARPRIAIAIFLSALAYGLLQLLVFFWPVYLVEKTPDAVLGISTAWLLAYGARSIGSMSAKRADPFRASGIVLVSATALYSLPVLVFKWSTLRSHAIPDGQALALVPIVAYAIIRLADGFLDPLRQTVLNTLVPGSFRATVLSCGSMTSMLIAAIALGASSVALTHGITITQIWLGCGLVVLLTSPLYLLVVGKEHDYGRFTCT